MRLHIAAGAISVGPDAARAAGAGFAVPIGWEDIARDYLKHSPPTPAELEAAITRIEDEIMPRRAAVPGQTRVETNDPGIRDIARVAGLQDATPLTLDLQAVERVFNALADVASGSPSGSRGLPEAPRFAATLLILRELMHHLNIPSISVHS